ncbi:programmed cell death protein 7 [Betta splendens]|uniref:Programmed cell death protein 7 n=1 Tax=Betta splendens TaxID=158456 RepID=A0A6P7M524_BETSP|nr:programmed cell death protein 7 [Betta splendens]
MDNAYQYPAPSEQQRPPGFSGGYAEQWSSSPGPTQPGQAGPGWDSSPAYYSHQSYGFNLGPTPYGGPPFGPPFGFDPSLPPPPFGCPPPGHMLPPAPVNTYNITGAFPQREFQSFSVPSQNRHREYNDLCQRGAPGLSSPAGQNFIQRSSTTTQSEDTVQRRQDAEWIRRFLQRRDRVSKTPKTQQQQPDHNCVPALRDALYGAARLISVLEKSCETLKQNVENDTLWTDSYLTALDMKSEIQDKLKLLSDAESLNQLKAKVTRLSQRKARRQRAKKRLQMEAKRRQEELCEKEAAIDKWRMKKIHEVEEKKREQELKLAADSVLCEVRRKQADIKRMQDIMRSLEKLRKLRKEAASRKGIVSEQKCDESFASQLEQLRNVMKKRTAVYSAEEKALMVMLEGEQEEERRREHERQAKKEREKQLQRKYKVDSMLFGEDLPADPIQLPFREYYTVAQHSLPALIQIRREWDVFVVAADHPDATPIPQSWVLPDVPSDQDWASALQMTDTDGDTL